MNNWGPRNMMLFLIFSFSLYIHPLPSYAIVISHLFSCYSMLNMTRARRV